MNRVGFAATTIGATLARAPTDGEPSPLRPGPGLASISRSGAAHAFDARAEYANDRHDVETHAWRVDTAARRDAPAAAEERRMRSLIDFYATQVRLLWEWRGGRVALAKRLLVTLIVAAVSFAVTAALLPGIAITTWTASIVAVALMSLFNAVLRPLVLAIVVPRSLILTG